MLGRHFHDAVDLLAGQPPRVAVRLDPGAGPAAPARHDPPLVLDLSSGAGAFLLLAGALMAWATAQSLASLLASMAVLLIAIVIERRFAAFERRLRRIDRLIDRAEDGEKTESHSA